MASIQRLTSRLTGRTSYRVQIRLKGNPSQSATFRNRKDAERWAASVESAILEWRHFPHTRGARTSFGSLAQRYRDSVLAEASASRRATAERHMAWWLGRFGDLTLAEVTPDRIAEARDAIATEPVTRGERKSVDTRGLTPTCRHRSGATVNRYLATLSHMFTTAVREWRLIERNPVRDITRKKESRGRTRFLSDPEREALLKACAASGWPALGALVLLAISTGARRGELIRLRWTDVTLAPPSPCAIIPDSKNGDPRRLPLVGRALRALIAVQRANGGGSPFVFPSRVDPGRPYRAFDCHWYAALAAAGLQDFRFHDLRHYLPSLTMSGSTTRA